MKRLFSHIVLSFLVAILLATPAISCVNTNVTLISGEIIDDFPEWGDLDIKLINDEQLRVKAEDLYKRYQETDSLSLLSDHAAALIYLGKYEKAKRYYHFIEKNEPNLYTTASNLGTIYELLGKADSALLWIKRSIELNPDSHEGSEWIHVKILEYKVNGAKEDGSSILGLNFGTDVIPTNNGNRDLSELYKDIRHQLEERCVFVQPENYVVGNILFDFGNVIALEHNLESALTAYNNAIRYGFSTELMSQRMERFKQMTKKAEESNEIITEDKEDRITSYISYAITASVFALLFFLILRFFRKRRLGRRPN